MCHFHYLGGEVDGDTMKVVHYHCPIYWSTEVVMLELTLVLFARAWCSSPLDIQYLGSGVVYLSLFILGGINADNWWMLFIFESLSYILGHRWPRGAGFEFNFVENQWYEGVNGCGVELCLRLWFFYVGSLRNEVGIWAWAWTYIYNFGSQKFRPWSFLRVACTIPIYFKATVKIFDNT